MAFLNFRNQLENTHYEKKYRKNIAYNVITKLKKYKYFELPLNYFVNDKFDGSQVKCVDAALKIIFFYVCSTCARSILEWSAP